MSTVTEQWAEYDRKFLDKFKHETQRHEISEWTAQNQSDAAFRGRLPLIAQAESDLAAMREHLGKLLTQQDEAVSNHAAICGPLQAALEAGNLSPEERIAARVKVNEANSELERVSKELQPAIEAAQTEIEVLRPRAAARKLVEMAFCNSGSEKQVERQRALRKAHEMLEQKILFSFRRQDKAGSLDSLGHAVWHIFHECSQRIRAEQEQIRERRLQELYQAD